MYLNFEASYLFFALCLGVGAIEPFKGGNKEL